MARSPLAPGRPGNPSLPAGPGRPGAPGRPARPLSIGKDHRRYHTKNKTYRSPGGPRAAARPYLVICIENISFFIELNLLVLLFDLVDLVDLGSLDHLVDQEYMMCMLDLVDQGDLEKKK